jgi:hypothetical protein
MATENDKGVVWHDENGKLVSFCPCCKQHHADADADPAITALTEALDLIEETLWLGFDGVGCSYCEVVSGLYGHAADCKGALFLRKHGRKVHFEGEPDEPQAPWVPPPERTLWFCKKGDHPEEPGPVDGPWLADMLCKLFTVTGASVNRVLEATEEAPAGSRVLVSWPAWVVKHWEAQARIEVAPCENGYAFKIRGLTHMQGMAPDAWYTLSGCDAVVLPVTMQWLAINTVMKIGYIASELMRDTIPNLPAAYAKARVE